MSEVKRTDVKEDHIKNKVKAYRRFMDWTQEELSEKSGVSKSTIWFMETKRIKEPTISIMRSVAKAFGKKVEEIFDINDEWTEEETRKIFFKK